MTLESTYILMPCDDRAAIEAVLSKQTPLLHRTAKVQMQQGLQKTICYRQKSLSIRRTYGSSSNVRCQFSRNIDFLLFWKLT